MRGQRGYPALDLCRVPAAVLVAAIHTSPLLDLWSDGDFLLVSVVARVAVPFFFMTSGFFTVTRYARDAGALGLFLRRTLGVYLAAIVLYLPVNLRNGWLSGMESPWDLVREVLFEGTFYHLWYLPAAALGAAIAWGLVRRMGYPGAFIFSGFLYFFGILGESWTGLWARSGVFLTVFEHVSLAVGRTRCGLFFSPLFFVLGGWLRDGGRELSRPAGLLGFTVSLLLMAGEALELRALGWARYYTMYLTLPLAAVFLFQVLLTFRGPRRPVARSFALLFYILHPMGILAVRVLARGLGIWEILVEENLVHFLAVCAVTAGVCWPMAALWQRARPRRTDSARGRAWREIELGALRHNVGELRRVMPTGSELTAVVKADAYGHGAFAVARELDRMGVRSYAVAAADEGIALRRYGVRGEILILGWTDPARAGELRRYRLTQALVSLEYAAALSGRGVAVRAQVKVDTGMHRLGCPWDDPGALAALFALPNLRITGMFTHLSRSETRESEDAAFCEEQARRFREAAESLRRRGLEPGVMHLMSTYGLLNYPELTAGPVRCGLGIYGVLSAPGEVTAVKADLRPVLSLRARVALIRAVPAGETLGYAGGRPVDRDTRAALLSVGYGDGVPRSLSDGAGYVLLHGKPAPILGLVCMDQMAVDVTDIPEAAPGDVATIIGCDGDAQISAPEVARMAGTITNELLSRLGARVRTVVVGER